LSVFVFLCHSGLLPRKFDRPGSKQTKFWVENWTI
jgi:hypothetical protein